MASKRKGPAAERRAVERFNASHSPGARVRFWTGVREGEGRAGTTEGEALLLSGHTAVVKVRPDPVDGVVQAGSVVALSHVEVLRD